MAADVPEFYATDRQDWRRWLSENHATERAVWLVYDKGPARTMSWADTVQESLCFGWIDSKPGKISDTRSKIYICRRSPKSAWSKVNKGHIDQLTANGLMMPANVPSTTPSAVAHGTSSTAPTPWRCPTTCRLPCMPMIQRANTSKTSLIHRSA